VLRLLEVGYCFHPEAIVMSNGSWRKMKFPAYVGLIKHPVKGYLLFDTGYAKRFLDETSGFPEKFYRWLTPMHLCDKHSLIGQLRGLGISSEDIKYIFISHFHADHISGLLDFESAKYICSKEAFGAIKSLGRVRGLVKGYLPGLLPRDFLSRCMFIEDLSLSLLDKSMAPFVKGYDVFGDGSALAVSLPGHASGHFGLLSEHNGKSIFLIGDAAWTADSYESSVRPNRITHLIMDDGSKYLDTLDRLSSVYSANSNLLIVPSHCERSFRLFNEYE